MSSGCGVSGHSKYTAMMSQLYTFSPWAKAKSFSHGTSGPLPYVGFPGLTLTPIPENPLLDSMHQEEVPETSEHDKWLHDNVMDDTWTPHTINESSLPHHWSLAPTGLACQDVDATKDCDMSSKTCSIDMSSKQNFLPKNCDLATEGRRSHLMKLLLFALCGVVIVAGIVLWIFSPAFV